MTTTPVETNLFEGFIKAFTNHILERTEKDDPIVCISSNRLDLASINDYVIIKESGKILKGKDLHPNELISYHTNGGVIYQATTCPKCDCLHGSKTDLCKWCANSCLF